jgi:dTDP-4-amino-4,6-dideoxygalactose transaminase
VGLCTLSASCLQTFPVLRTTSFISFLVPNDTRNALMSHLRELGVQAPFHYLPLEQSAFGATFGGLVCPVSSSVAERLLRLPLFDGITEHEIQRVIDAVQSFTR